MNPIDKYFINQKSFDEAVEDDAMFDIDFSSYENSINNNFPNNDVVIGNESNFSNLFDKDGFQVPLPKQEYLSSYQDNRAFDKNDSIKEEVPSVENQMNGFDQAELLISSKIILKHIITQLTYYSELSIIGNTQSKIKELFKQLNLYLLLSDINYLYSELKQDLSNIEELLNRREVEEAREFSNLESILKFTSSKFDELSSISSD